jgi:predicted DNA-binding transcriptional regulator AlpA
MQNIIVTTSDELRGLIGEAIRSALAETIPQQQTTLPESEEKLLNEHELRGMLGLSHPTIIRLRKQGLLPYLRLGKRIMYSPTDVRAAMEKQAFRGGRK